MLAWHKGTVYPASVLDRILFATRHLDTHGVLRFHDWKLYAERGLPKAPVTLWVYEGSLKVEYQAVTLATYSVEVDDDHRQVRQVSNPHLIQTPFRSPQLTLWTLGPDDWVFYWRAKPYARSRRKRTAHEISQQVLFEPFGGGTSRRCGRRRGAAPLVACRAEGPASPDRGMSRRVSSGVSPIRA